MKFSAILFSALALANASYSPSGVTVDPIRPTGIRISIPDEPGISLVAFHIKINEEFDGLEAGHIAEDIRKAKDGRWTYKNRRTQLRNGDVVHYWIHVVRHGLGYNLIEQPYRVDKFVSISVMVTRTLVVDYWLTFMMAVTVTAWGGCYEARAMIRISTEHLLVLIGISNPLFAVLLVPFSASGKGGYGKFVRGG